MWVWIVACLCTEWMSLFEWIRTWRACYRSSGDMLTLIRKYVILLVPQQSCSQSILKRFIFADGRFRGSCARRQWCPRYLSIWWRSCNFSLAFSVYTQSERHLLRDHQWLNLCWNHYFHSYSYHFIIFKWVEFVLFNSMYRTNWDFYSFF